MPQEQNMRLAAYVELRALFERYALLSGQLSEAAIGEDVNRLVNLLDLRQEQLGRIERLQRKSPSGTFDVPLADEKDSAVLQERQILRQIAERCERLEIEVAPLLDALSEQLKVEAGAATFSQRKLRGYTNGLGGGGGRYVEDRK